MTETAIPTTGTAPLEVAQAYLAAWNAHDGAAVRATFGPEGTYVDPTLPGPIGGEHLEGYVAALVAAFPDLHFDVEGVSADGDRVIAQWRMRGTNTGPLPGMPEPTGGTCALPGVDMITVGPAGIVSVVGYFDQKTFVEQLGLQALVVPADAPPMVFGMAMRTDLGITAMPGALSMTWIELDSAEDVAELELRGGEIVETLAAEPGFLGWLGTTTGERHHTVTAWTGPAAAEAAMARNAPHRAAVQRIRAEGFGVRGFTSIWVPHRLNQQMADCPSCGTKQWIDAGAAGVDCGCGARVEVTSYL